MTKTNPNPKLSIEDIKKIKRKQKWLIIIGSFFLACSIACLICVILYLK